MVEKWYCPNCEDGVEPEYAIENKDCFKCPICNTKLIYPKPEE